MYYLRWPQGPKHVVNKQILDIKWKSYLSCVDGVIYIRIYIDHTQQEANNKDCLIGNVYEIFLRNKCQVLEDVSLMTRLMMYIQNDRAPMHYTRHVRNVYEPCESLDRLQWTPGMAPRSPDFNPVNYFLWGYMNSLMYETKAGTRPVLLRHLFAATYQIWNHNERVSAAEKCWEAHGLPRRKLWTITMILLRVFNSLVVNKCIITQFL
jgi:hypothetical protein